MSEQQQPSGGGQLSHFESLSAITPKKQPLAILFGTALVPVVLWIINLLAPTEAVEDLKGKGEKGEGDKPAVTAPADDIDDI